jgi:hypothetical protein
MTEHVDHQPNGTAPESDCGCGCNGAEPCNDTATTPTSKARRAMMLGAGSAAFIATLANRRAFAAGAECGPVSHAASLHHSAHGNTSPSTCGGSSPGFWKNHKTCVTSALSNNDPTTVTLGSKLPELNTIDPGSAGTTFKNALCNNGDASHWACAILNALSPGINPNYGYTIASLNTAITKAHNAGVSATNILDALKTLENDFNVNQSVCGSANSLC